MNNIYAVIMAGGSGERFWPKSRRRLPKQLLPIITEKSMLAETLARLKGVIPLGRTYIITNKIQEKLVRKESRCKNVIAEPLSKNTAPCIAVAAFAIKKKDPDAIMAVLPADQAIKDLKKFQKELLKAIDAAKKGDVLVTIGMKPYRPHTGYGYIKKGDKISDNLYKVSRFTEKPNYETAKGYVSSGEYLWNGGMFIWKVSAVLKEIKKYLPALYNLCKEGGLNKIYKNAENISIDYGIMEKTKKAVVIEADYEWDDVGSWAALDRHIAKDRNGNITKGNVLYRDVCNSTIISDSTLVAGIGLNNLVIVATKDAVLVCSKEKTEDVKHIVGVLKTNKKHKGYL